MENRETTLSIRNLTVSYRQRSIWLEAVRDFSMDIAPGQVYGLVGESGSGKSTVALAVMGYLSQNGRIDEGEILFGERDIVQLSRANMRDLWGEQITLVPQNPLSSLNPSLRIGDQIGEILRQHRRMSREAAQVRAVELLDMVRVADPARVARSYPHEISGGMQQRALIAMALSTEPSLLVLDEPTTGLDVTTQAAVLDLLRDLIEGRQTSVLYVTHNLGVVARICDRVAVLYAGELVEDGPVDELFADPIHPYTMGLLESVPHVRRSRRDVQLEAIPGQIPSLGDREAGCVFAPRCWAAIERCSQARPPIEATSAERFVRCIRWDEIVEGLSAGTSEIGAADPGRRWPNGDDALLAIEDLQVHFKMGRSIEDVLHGRPGEVVKAVDGVNLKLMKGQALGIVGESGSGKTTLARAVVGLAARTSGEIKLRELSLPERLDERPLELRKRLQYVFQNPEEALNPYMTVGQTLKRPLVKLLRQSDEEAAMGARKLLEAVQLPADYVGRLPDQLSGGEKQRVAIARAFATQPELLIADEPVSSLDVSVQASILNLLRELQAENQNTLIFISHDLAVVGYVSHIVAVMYAGYIMEIAPARSLFEPPYHPYTEALLSAIPSLDPTDQDEPIQLPGDVPSQKTELGGCPFHPRCPRLLGEICRTETPPWRQLEGGGSIFCHIHLEELSTLQKQVARTNSKASQ